MEMARKTDELLVEHFKQGDDSAFEKIVEEYSADIAVLANRLLGWPGEVEDVVQDVFLAAFAGLKKFRCECSLKTWLFTITINKCRSRRYRRAIRMRRFSKKAEKHLELYAEGAGKHTMDRETFESIRTAVRALPAKYREPVVLRYLQELSMSQTSSILGITENALQVRLSRARSLLKQRLLGLIKENL
jgi:RNA polymerase sigma-70 factor (ECF subfamily)